MIGFEGDKEDFVLSSAYRRLEQSSDVSNARGSDTLVEQREVVMKR